MCAGRLDQTIEQGTKRGLFAIGNYVNQRLLKPVHDFLMASYCADRWYVQSGATARSFDWLFMLSLFRLKVGVGDPLLNVRDLLSHV